MIDNNLLKMEIDLEEVEYILHSEKYAQWLLSNTANFSTAAFILQAGLDACEKLKEQLSSDTLTATSSSLDTDENI